MSKRQHYPYSIASTVSDALDPASSEDQYDMQCDLSIDDVSLQRSVKTDTQSDVMVIKDISEDLDEIQRKITTRWNSCLDKRIHTTPRIKQINHAATSTSRFDQVVVREFLPRTSHDPILPVLRELFVLSFNDFYKEIEAQLKIKSNKTLVKWLQETFDEMQDELLDKKSRCFMLCSSDIFVDDKTYGILAFLTLKEEKKGSVYIAQCAVEAEKKRHGYGAHLLRHLGMIYPSGTYYWGLCRRANLPAVKFYLKQGATLMDDEDVAEKYGYDPTLYTGFQFTDTIGSLPSSKILSSNPPDNFEHKLPTPSAPREKQQPSTKYQDASTMTDPLLDVEKPKKIKHTILYTMGERISKIISMINACVSPHVDVVSMSSVSSVSQPNETPFIATTPEGSTLPDGVTIVWLDAGANSNSNDSSTTRLMLHEIHSHICTFDDANLCRNFLSTITNRQSRVFLIVSGKLSSIILSNLATLTAIDSVFIFCAHPEAYENLIVEYSPNVIGVFSHLKSLKSSLEAELSNYVIRAPIFNFFAQKQKPIRDLTHDAASFLWFQLFQKLLMKNTYDNSDMKHMIDYCRKHYQRNTQQHKFFSEIDEFEKNYKYIDAISWYTRQSFVYKLINSALRTEDIEALYIFRCYISDLCRALANEHKTFRIQNQKSPVLTLYRGSHMTSKELDKLRDTIGGMTSINGFISTSRQQYVAEVFASRDSHRGPDTQKVVWIIEADSRSDDIVFASVVHHSQHSHEEEVLFNIGTTLCIHDVIMNEATNMWHIKATTTHNGANVVADYMELLRCELNETSEKVVLGTLLIDMGKYETAQHYFEDLINRNSDHKNSDLPAYHYNLALTHSFQGAYNLAEINFHQALECQIYQLITTI
ncbi:unnamed protein product [Rotaria magnacalcarata]|uniref:N-acetyltransferase domain-containing protein n=5 Tax=Rotaria magnacalcarata TaxID=392030 RepID=A0A816KKI1_9BILA|nr:unnamed protein product [Rotaria magnacalcarata]